MARQIWRHGHLSHLKDEGVGRREPAAQEYVLEERLKAEIVAEYLAKK